MKIKIQSFVDVITNSSTEIYTCCSATGIDKIKELINLFTDNKCDELFTITKIVTSEEDVEGGGYYYNKPESHYEVLPIVQSETNIKIAEILSNLEKLFDIDAEYDG